MINDRAFVVKYLVDFHHFKGFEFERFKRLDFVPFKTVEFDGIRILVPRYYLHRKHLSGHFKMLTFL